MGINVAPALRSPIVRIAPALVLAALLLTGCRLPHRVGKTETGAPRYDRINLVYDMNARYRDLPLFDGRLQRVAFSNDSTPQVPQRWKGARLSITYPHPEGASDTARATLRLSGADAQAAAQEKFAEAKPGWMEKLHEPADFFSRQEQAPDTSIAALHSDEVWVLDFPRSELDLLLADLAQSGFFETQVRETPGTHLDVRIDSGRTTKAWTPEPRFDDFVNRVYAEGRLSGFVAGDAKHESDPSPIAFATPRSR